MMPTRRSPLLFRAGSAVALVLVLAGCTPGGQFDPTTMFDNDMFDTKTKLKGDRAAVFPDGVPGTTTGVPADLVKGYQAPPDQAAGARALRGCGRIGTKQTEAETQAESRARRRSRL